MEAESNFKKLGRAGKHKRVKEYAPQPEDSSLLGKAKEAVGKIFETLLGKGDKTRKQLPEFKFGQPKGHIRPSLTVPKDMAYAFIYEGAVMPVDSSAIKAAMYLIDSKELVIFWLKSGNATVYEDVSDVQAIQFGIATSKNSWIWENMRIPGSKTGFKHFYRTYTGTIPTNIPTVAQITGTRTR